MDWRTVKMGQSRGRYRSVPSPKHAIDPLQSIQPTTVIHCQSPSHGPDTRPRVECSDSRGSGVATPLIAEWRSSHLQHKPVDVRPQRGWNRKTFRRVESESARTERNEGAPNAGGAGAERARICRYQIGLRIIASRCRCGKDVQTRRPPTHTIYNTRLTGIQLNSFVSHARKKGTTELTNKKSSETHGMQRDREQESKRAREQELSGRANV